MQSQKTNTDLPEKMYTGIVTHLKQDIAFDKFIRMHIDCSKKLRDKFVFQERKMDGSGVRRLITEIEQYGIYALAFLIFKEKGILCNQSWLSERIKPILDIDYSADLSDTTFSYMKIDTKIEQYITNQDWSHLDDGPITFSEYKNFYDDLSEYITEFQATPFYSTAEQKQDMDLFIQKLECINYALSIRNYPVPEDIWLQLCYHHFACMDYVPKDLKTEQFFEKLMAMEGFHFSMFEPEMTDAQLITCLENSRHIDSDKIKKARKVWTPELLEAIAANCTYPLKIIPKKYVTLELVKIGLKNERHYLSDVPKDYLSKELCIYAYIHHPFRTMEVIPDEFKTPDFYAEIIKHGEFYPKDIPNEYLTEEALIQYVSSKKCYGLDDIPDPWKTTPAVMKAFSDYHIDRYIYPDEEHCERACERAEKIEKRSLEYILSKCEIQPSKYVWDVICNSRTGIHAIKNPTREMWRASIQEFPENILEAPEWFLQTDSLTIVSTSAKHIDEKKKIEEKLERAAEQSSLDNQMSIFDLFPDF